MAKPSDHLRKSHEHTQARVRDAERSIGDRIERIRERVRQGASDRVVLLAILDLLADEL